MASNGATSDVSDENVELLELIKTNHDEAYLYVSQGLAYQEQKQYSLATDMYRKGLDKINAGLNIRCDKEYCRGPKWENARKLQEKMRKTSQLIRSQLQGISFDSAFAIPPYTPEPYELPPSYDEACEHDFVVVSRRLSDSGTPVEVNGIHRDSRNRRNSAEVSELFCVPEGVQLFFVSYDGSVTTNNTQTSLYVYQFVDSNNDVNIKPPAWLQIGSWTYPLIPGQSPALESSYGAFLFPNVGNARDSAVGVILPPSVSPEERSEFLQLLHQLTALREEKRAQLKDAEIQVDHTSSSFSETISRGIVTGAEYLSAGIVKGAAVSSNLIHKGASKAKQKINPEDKPVVVDPRVREGLRIAHEASGYALKATGYLVNKLGELTVSLGRQLAPHVREQSTKLLTTAFKRDPADAKDTVDGVLTVAAGGLQGFSTIYMGLENAAKMLAYSLSTETVNIVGHKYGGEAGEVVGDAVSSIGNLALTTHNVQSLGVKSIAKRTAKDTGKAILKDYSGQVNLPEK